MVDLTVLDCLEEFFRELETVPKWRLFLAFFILGEKVSKPIINLAYQSRRQTND